MLIDNDDDDYSGDHGDDNDDDKSQRQWLWRWRWWWKYAWQNSSWIDIFLLFQNKTSETEEKNLWLGQWGGRGHRKFLLLTP